MSRVNTPINLVLRHAPRVDIPQALKSVATRSLAESKLDLGVNEPKVVEVRLVLQQAVTTAHTTLAIYTYGVIFLERPSMYEPVHLRSTQV